jgi:amidohydrolase
MAAAEVFDVHIIGKGGHGAIPNLTVDPIVASAQVVTALQNIVSRNVSPLETAVVSVTTIHGGEAFNVIPPRVEFQGTIRTFDPDIRKIVLSRFEEIVTGVSTAMGCQVEIELKSLTPAVTNDLGVTKSVQASAVRILPSDDLENTFRTMGSEDMAFFLEQVPGCFVFIGSANQEKGFDAPHHHPRFDIDEDVLPKAAALLAGSAVDLLMV